MLGIELQEVIMPLHKIQRVVNLSSNQGYSKYHLKKERICCATSSGVARIYFEGFLVKSAA